MLTKQQEKAMAHFKGPALILAVPGAGKTTVLIHRTANLIEKHKINPRKILSITFSKASARDMKNRFNREFKDLSYQVEFSTIHSFCFNLLRNYAKTTRQVFTLIEDSKNTINKYSLLRQIFLEINRTYITEDAMESLLNYIGYVKNMMISPEDLNPREIPNFNAIYRQYEDIKRQNNYIDFDDMLSMSLNILKNNQNTLNYYRNKYDFIQLDEGQDTSLLQLEIIKLLAIPENNLFVVADDDQSIYGFRGAYPDALLNFKSIYSDAEIFLMEENFRSTESIIKASKKLISNNMKRFRKDIFTSQGGKNPVKLVRLTKIEDQYAYIIDKILKNPQGEFAILYRNNISAIGLINQLEKNKLDFYIKDRNLKFFNHWILEDVFNFLDFAQDTSNIGLYEKIYYKKKGYISKKQVNYAKKLNPKDSVFKRIKSYPDIKPFYLDRLSSLELDFKKLSSLKAKEAINYIKHDLAYLDYLKEFSDKFGYGFSSLSIILKFLELISEDLKNQEELRERLNILRSKCLNSSFSNINLSTIHSAKGLEFENVFLIDLVEGDFPSQTSIEEAERDNFKYLEEERRLFYVAMTRAKYNLTLFTVDMVDSSKVESSRFIREIVMAGD